MLKHGWGVAHIFIVFRLVEGEGASGFCCILVVGEVVLALLYPCCPGFTLHVVTFLVLVST